MVSLKNCKVSLFGCAGYDEFVRKMALFEIELKTILVKEFAGVGQ